MLAHVFPARADAYGFSEPRKPRQFPFGKHVPISDVVAQLCWHKYDFMLFGMILIVAFISALTCLVRAAFSSTFGNPYTVALSSIFVAVTAYTAIRTASAMQRRAKALEHLPGPTPKLWLPGFMGLIIRKDPHRYSTVLAERFGPIFKFRVLCFHVVCITDPVLATHVLRSKHVDKLRFQYSFLDPFLGGTNLLTGHTDEHWKAVRKAVAPSFSAGNMRLALSHIVERTLALAGYLAESGEKKTHNVDNLLLRESMDVIGRFGFQKEMNALKSLKMPNAEENHNVQALLNSTQEIEDRYKIFWRWWRVWRADVRAGWVVLGRFKNIVRGLLTHIKKTELQRGSFAELLLKAKDPKTGKPLTDAKMFPEIAALFFAGVDTTGHTGTFCLFAISQHPEVEAKIVEELQSHGLLATAENPDPRQLTYPDLGKLTYLQAVIKETLRMYPPVGIGQVRISNSHDITLADRLHIPAGTCIWVPHHAIQNASFNWDDPTKFMPERWLTPGTEYAVPEKLPLPKEWYKNWDLDRMSSQASAGSTETMDTEGSDSRRPKRYFPFAEGPRSCVGQSLAKVSLVATMATLLSRFSFKLAEEMGGAEGVRKAEQYTLVVGLNRGMMMHAVPRQLA
ncbi:g7259 [Coccomyxa viridis]|uniref:G7259 protein n=1 Tax=Coccomyxa viridis TaxID=1274662 RepID=A0ABP1G2A1_9CHLO